VSQQQTRGEQAAADLLVAARLAQQLRMHTGQVEQLLEQLAAGDAIDDTATEAATVRSSLEAAAEQRRTLLQRWEDLPARLDALPPDAVRPVQLEVATIGDLDGLSWVALRARLTPLLAQVDRLEAAQAAMPQRARPVPDDLGVGTWLVAVEVDPAWYELRGALAHSPCPPPASHTVRLVGPVALVGRSSPVADQQPQIVLDADTSVSRRHAQFVVGGRSLTVVDLSSTNGTYVIGADSAPDAETSPLVPGVPRELHDGDHVYLGAWTRLTVRIAAD
jgi:hypothetical protein